MPSPPSPLIPLSAPLNPRYIPFMQTLITYLIPVVMLATLGVLVYGVVGMARGKSPERSNRLMWTRVALQGSAIVLLLLLAVFAGR